MTINARRTACSLLPSPGVPPLALRAGARGGAGPDGVGRAHCACVTPGGASARAALPGQRRRRRRRAVPAAADEAKRWAGGEGGAAGAGRTALHCSARTGTAAGSERAAAAGNGLPGRPKSPRRCRGRGWARFWGWGT